MILGFACGGNDEDNDAPVISGLIAPDFIPIGFSRSVYFTLDVDDNQGLDDIQLVYFTILYPGTTSPTDTLYMYDNGEDGDVTNGDGTFTYEVTSENTPQTAGDYTYSFIAVDSKNSYSESIGRVITIDETSSPYIYDLTTPDYIQISFPEYYLFTVKVEDQDGLDDVNSVFFLVEDPQGSIDPDTSFMYDDGTEHDVTANDGIYSYAMTEQGDFTFEGDYIFHFHSIDNYYNVSNELVDTIFIDDGPNPMVYDLVAPDSLPRGSDSTSFLSVRVWDPQGLADVDSASFWVYRPDGTTNGSMIGLFDDGQRYGSGDSVANDGIYSRGIQAPNTESQLGTFTFYFAAFDSEGNSSDTLSKLIEVYDPGIVTNDESGEYIRPYEVPNMWR